MSGGGGSEMAEWIKLPAAKFEDLSSIPVPWDPHGRKSQFLQAVL